MHVVRSPLRVVPWVISAAALALLGLVLLDRSEPHPDESVEVASLTAEAPPTSDAPAGLDLDPLGHFETRDQVSGDRTLQTASVSFVTNPGDQGSFRTVPDGVSWRLVNLRAINCEAEVRPLDFVLTDAQGVTRVALPEGVSPVSVAGGSALSWTGDVVVPSGWRVYARWHDMAGGVEGCNWQYGVFVEPVVDAG